MTRLIGHILILLVLFTHSAMAMDIHIPEHMDHSSQLVSSSVDSVDVDSGGVDNTDLSISSGDSESIACADASGHCSHHQAHTTGLLSKHSFSNARQQAIPLSLLNQSAFILKQTPPLRPPKA